MKKLLVLAVIATCGIVGWRALRGSGDDAAVTHDDKLVLDRIWIDHMPKNDRDQISAFVAITEEPIGIFQTTSVWKGNFEMFRYEAHGHELRVLYPQTGDREKATARASRCEQRDFDYCLQLEGASRGVQRYYSRKGWEVNGAAGPTELRARVEALAAAAAP